MLARLATASLVAAGTMHLAGCSPPLAGTHDAALEYSAGEPGAPPPTAAALERLASDVKARLSAASVPADVAITPGHHVAVVVDADAAGEVDALLLWRGGIQAYGADDTVDLGPAGSPGLRAATYVGPGGQIERGWEGPSERVTGAIAHITVDPNHRVFAERRGRGISRTRVVATPALFGFGTAAAPLVSVTEAAHGRAIALVLPAAAQESLAAYAATRPFSLIVLARGPTWLATLPTDATLSSPLVVSSGDDLAAFARARDTERLLATPELPALTRTSAVRLPPRWGLAAACALLPFALSLGWLFFVRRFDRARPEPWWLVAATFALGGLSVLPAAVGELVLGDATPWLNPNLITLGGQLWALPLTIPVFALVVGFSEEGSKFLAAWSLAGHRAEFDEPVDGIVYGCAAALGFAAVENVKYFTVGRMSGAIIALRAFVTVPAHMFFGAIWGYAMGRRLVSRRTRVFDYLAAAALAHGTFDALLSTEAAQPLAVVLVLPLGFAFVVLLRLALRHGAVRHRPWETLSAPGTDALPASALPRRFFRVGSRAAFWTCASAMVGAASILVGTGTAYEVLHHRVGPVFVSAATLMLVLFGGAAYGATATMPLDVVVDAHGITFAGARTSWAAVFGVVVQRRRRTSFVLVRTVGRDLRLGPLGAPQARDLATAIGAARGEIPS